MNAVEIVNKLMNEKGIKQADMAAALGLTPAALWERIKPSKENISVKKLSEMLRYLGYDIVIMPRGKAGRIDGAFVVDKE